jgi:hypothetical protein
MSYASFFELIRIPAALVCGCVLVCVCHGQEEGHPAAALGTMRADRILILGNSITLHGPWEAGGWKHPCGMAAGVPEKDYVHLLVAGLDARTGAEANGTRRLSRPRNGAARYMRKSSRT